MKKALIPGVMSQNDSYLLVSLLNKNNVGSCIEVIIKEFSKIINDTVNYNSQINFDLIKPEGI